MTYRLTAFIPPILFATSAWSDTPRVVTDIPPVHSLAAMVMGDLGTPEIILPPGSDPHSHAMRPSEARAVEGADLIVWIGPDLTPWLDRALDNLAPDAARLALLDVPGTVERAYAEAHDDDHGEHEDHDGHDDAGDHDVHDAAHDDHGGHDGHDHDGRDPHAWLDPANAAVWLGALAEALAAQDPDNADTYRRNATEGMATIRTAATAAQARLAPVRDRPFLVAHDAWGHFAAAFDLQVAGALADGDAAPQGAAGLSEIRSLEAVCLLTEPETTLGLGRTVTEGREMAVAQADPLGRALALGADQYVTWLDVTSRALAGCLAE